MGPPISPKIGELDVDPVRYSRLGDRNISVLTTAYFWRNARLNDIMSGPTR